MNTSAIRKMRMFKRNASGISGREARKLSQLKNDSRTAPHPGALVTTRTTTTAKTTVERSAMTTLLPPD
jgi:hypothetical protein